MAGQIQSSINNIIGMAAVAKKLDPKAQEEAKRQEELKNLDSRESELAGRREALEKSLKDRYKADENGNVTLSENAEQDRFADLEETQMQNEETLNIAKRRYELSPSVDTYNKYREAQNVYNNFNDYYQPRKKAYDERRQEQAMADMKSQADSMSKQKSGYKRYMDINAMYDRVKKGEISQDEYEAWFSALPGSQPDDDRDFDNAVGR